VDSVARPQGVAELVKRFDCRRFPKVLRTSVTKSSTKFVEEAVESKQTMISIVTKKIDTQTLLQSVSSPKSGATVLFVGTTRQFTGHTGVE